MSRLSLPRDGDRSYRAPIDVREHKLGNPRDLSELPGAGMERWSQVNDLPGEQHPQAQTPP